MNDICIRVNSLHVVVWWYFRIFVSWATEQFNEEVCERRSCYRYKETKKSVRLQYTNFEGPKREIYSFALWKSRRWVSVRYCLSIVIKTQQSHCGSIGIPDKDWIQYSLEASMHFSSFFICLTCFSHNVRQIYKDDREPWGSTCLPLDLGPYNENCSTCEALGLSTWTERIHLTIPWYRQIP